MKTILLSTLLFLINLSSFNAQEIPNGDFEEWELFNTWNLSPVNWQTNNSQLLEFVQQDEDAFEGDWAMKVNTYGDFSIPGYAGLGMPIYNIPDKMTFAAKSFVDGFPGLSVSVEFYNLGNFVLGGYWSTQVTAADWSLEEIDFDDIEPVVDSVHIRVDAIAGDFAYGEGWLSLDDLQFQDYQAVEEVEDDNFALYPNPVTDELFLKNVPSGCNEIIIMDAVGREVLKSPNTVAHLDLSELSTGQYFVVLQGNEGILARERIVRD